MSSPDAQGNTQPLEENFAALTCSPEFKEGPWGWLLSISTQQLQPVLTPVKGEGVKVGRDPSCDLVLNEVIFTSSTDEDLQLTKVSRVQFQLKRSGTNVVLEDKSMNGTYVNGLKLGKGKQHSLDQGDTISVLQMDFEVFMFICEVRLRQLYPRSVTNKYLVGRVLGEGSSAVVREAFERNTHHQVAIKMIKKERWPKDYSGPDDNFKEVDIPLNIVHSCVTRVLEVFYEQMIFAIVMEYAPGVNFLMKL